MLLFNLTSNHRRKILHTTHGYPERWNDKIIILCDEIAIGLSTERLRTHHILELNDRCNNSNIINQKIKGHVYLLKMAILIEVL